MSSAIHETPQRAGITTQHNLKEITLPGKAERLNTTKCHNDSFAGFPLGKGQARQRSCNDINSTQFPKHDAHAQLAHWRGNYCEAHFTHTHFKSLQDHSCLTSVDEPSSVTGEKPARCQNHITPHLAVTKDDSGEFVPIIVIPRTSEPPPTAFPAIKPLLLQRAKGV